MLNRLYIRFLICLTFLFIVCGPASEEVRKIIGRAEELSRVTCEYCGAPGLPRGGGWIKTLCDNCNKERQ